MIAARFVWVFPATYLPRWLSPSLRRRDPSPPWQWTFVLAFTGVRGVVSLAAALAIPLTIASGAPFPQRDLILFITFGVIIITLVGQGLMLPSVIRWLGLARRRPRRAPARARGRACRARRSDRARRGSISNSSPASAALRAGGRRLAATRATITAMRLIPPISTTGWRRCALSNDLRMELIAAERAFLYELLRDGKITDESRRRLERELDLEEAAILSKREGETPL